MTEARTRQAAPSVTSPSARISGAGVARTYDRLAPLYDLMFGRVLEPGRRRMAELVKALQPASLLEVGVGTGLTLESYPTASRIRWHRPVARHAGARAAARSAIAAT